MAEFLAWRPGNCKIYLLAHLAAPDGPGDSGNRRLLFWVLTHAVGEYKLASALIVLSIWPSMVNSISAQANVATEDFVRKSAALHRVDSHLLHPDRANRGVEVGRDRHRRGAVSMRAVDFFCGCFQPSSA